MADLSDPKPNKAITAAGPSIPYWQLHLEGALQTLKMRN
jgi:hypothetical protein